MKVVKYTHEFFDLGKESERRSWLMSSGEIVKDPGDGTPISVMMENVNRQMVEVEVMQGSELAEAVESFMWNKFKMTWEWE